MEQIHVFLFIIFCVLVGHGNCKQKNILFLVADDMRPNIAAYEVEWLCKAFFRAMKLCNCTHQLWKIFDFIHRFNNFHQKWTKSEAGKKPFPNLLKTLMRVGLRLRTLEPGQEEFWSINSHESVNFIARDFSFQIWIA